MTEHLITNGQPPELAKDLTKTQATHPDLPNSVMMNPLDIHFQRERISQMMTIADTLVKANCFGRDVNNAFQAFVKIQAGAEMQMPPMEAMNSLYIVNGKITLWGAAVSKRIRDHGWKITYEEETETQVTAVVEKNGESHQYTATQKQLKDLGSKAAGFALADKLRWHALGRLLRFHIPEVMGNAVSYLKEEVDDLPDRSGKIDSPAMRLENAEFNADDFAPASKESGGNTIELNKENVAEALNTAKQQMPSYGEPVMEQESAPEPKDEPADLTKVEEMVISTIEDIKACESFEEVNELKEAFQKIVAEEARGGMTDQQVRNIWLALGEKLKEFPLMGKHPFGEPEKKTETVEKKDQPKSLFPDQKES